MLEYEEIREDIKNILSEKRYIHSLGVAKRAKELARIYAVDEQKAEIIGIAHDVAKEIPKEEALRYAIENGIVFDEIEKKEPALWHSKIGADIVEKKYGFTEDMKQAILYHTTGNIDMSLLDKIIYIADKTEENRTNSDLILAREMSNQNLEAGLLIVAKRAIEYSLKKDSLIHPDTIHMLNKIIIDSNNKN